MKRLTDLVPQEIKNIYHLFQSAIANVIYRFPSRTINVIGVTGTDGKTTTVSLIHHILKAAGVKVSMISTVKALVGEAIFDTGFHVTTPSPFEIQKFLRLMIKAGSKLAILEVTSHGLDQNRVAFLNFHSGVITNVTHEHLDYHKNYEAYLKTKSKILEGVKYRILNADEPSFAKLSAKGSGRLISFGIRKDADVSAKKIQNKGNGVEFEVHIKNSAREQEKLIVFLPMPGIFNVYNALAAVACVRAFDVENKVIVDSLKNFPGVVGRVEEIDEGQNFKVILDFAHTPNAFQQTLGTLKSRTRNRLICVFGAAGERDILKRPIMGEIAGKFCDYVVITSEDPRHEDINKITKEIAKGLEKSGAVLGESFWEVPDRVGAIKYAVTTLAKDGDTVAILGKGHEKSMNIGGVEYPWSDQIAASNALLERLKK